MQIIDDLPGWLDALLIFGNVFELIGAVVDSRLYPRFSHLSMKLQSDDPVVDCKPLIGAAAACIEMLRTGGQLKAIAVPVKDHHFPLGELRRPVWQSITAGNRKPADFSGGAGMDLSPEDLGQKLCTQTYSQNSSPRISRLTDETFFLDQPGIALLIADPHRPAHDDQQIDAGQFRQPLPSPKTGAVKPMASVSNPRFDHPQAFKRHVLKPVNIHIGPPG